MGLPGYGDRIVRNLGSVIRGTFDKDIKTRMRELESQLKKDTAAVQFVHTEGWKVIKGRFEEYLAGLTDKQLALGRNASNNGHAIEQVSDAIENARMILTIADNAVTQYEKTLTEHKEKVQQNAKQTGTAA